MKIYRVEHMRSDSEHDSYSYHSSMSKAKKAMTQAKKEAKEMESHYYMEEPQMIDVSLTKQGVLDLMNEYASYPNNG